ncbi:MAG: hypothetical protein H0V79_06095 [Actinobacteria bacterium]|nr:hypothetical protein [Actinomycetota bacterium]
MALTDSAPLTLGRLEDHRWKAADLFRNKVSNQKDYILALLFFKRASDRDSRHDRAPVVRQLSPRITGFQRS